MFKLNTKNDPEFLANVWGRLKLLRENFTDKQTQLVELLYLSRPPMTYEETAAELGISFDSVRDREDGVILKMKKEFVEFETLSPYKDFVENISHDLNIILKNSERISRIIFGLKSLSRNSNQDQFAKVQSFELIEASLALCNERFKHSNIDLECIENSRFEIQGHFDQLIQILVNWIYNAHDAAEQNQIKWVKIVVNPDEIRVIDSGPGIAEDQLSKLMEPFYTTKVVGKGTGLGLSISKGIADRHGANLFVDTTSPNTCFVLKFNPSAEKKT